MKFKIKLFARNIVNQEVIKTFISEISKDQNDKIKSWCNTILKNYLKNDYDNLKGVTKTKKNDPEWLKIAVQKKDAQEIIITDEFKRNLLEHIFPYFKTLTGNIKHSFSEAEKKTKEWDERKSNFDIKLTKGVKEILKCDNGYTWFEIIEEETLYNEGEIIQNCLRRDQHGPEYWDEIKKNEIKIFTLRDSKGIGHVGVEYIIDDNFIGQMNGKQNIEPIKIYHPFCISLIEYLKCGTTKQIKTFLNIIIVDNKIYDMFNLPDKLEIKGDLNLNRSKIIKLPNSLKVALDLDLSNSEIIKLPENLIVGGYLNLSYTKIKELSKNLEANESINLEYSKIIKLPDNLEVKGFLDLSNTKIKELPKNLKIVKTLYMRNAKIKELPKDLQVGCNIFISKDMKLKYIPKHLMNKIKI